MNLRPYQHTIVDFILTHPRCNLFVPMGLGKTVATLTALDVLLVVEDIAPILVIAPLRVAATTWPDEVAKFPHLRHLRVSVVVGSAAARRHALEQEADIYCINYDTLKWLVEFYKDRWPFRMVVADECSKLKGFRLRQGTRRARALATHVHTKVERYVGLTGTPAPNGLQDLWALMWMVDRGARLGTHFKAFIDRWFRAMQIGSDPHAVRFAPTPHASQEIQDKIRDLCLSLDPQAYFDLCQPIVNTIRVALPAHAQRLYKAMEQDMFIALECGAEVEAFNAASKTIKCLQLANGALYTDDTRQAWEVVHDAKLEALHDIIEEAAGMPVLVAYHFKSDVARLQRAFPKGRALDKHPDTIRDWNAGNIPVLFAHPASAGHGLNLQDGGNILAFFGHWWDLEQYQQIIERIGPTRQAQAGHKRPVFIHHIVAAGTVDELVMARRESKREVQDLLLEAVKRRETGKPLTSQGAIAL
ncbi:DEAD/DEAH box helicase [Xylella fastidiosa subsp. fastidiosa]|uniref:DEAD/DEAH box helicase n=1 Tax=Xylella fastidiosa TaxID=2371 RepID=UPI0007745C0B|nr:DEAD/DEAH box helicase [Xylella fastidiosa]UIT49718.1 DEAD/DEAH box helicase [Xylella fastidiosa subsp. fastidiosa]